MTGTTFKNCYVFESLVYYPQIQKLINKKIFNRQKNKKAIIKKINLKSNNKIINNTLFVFFIFDALKLGT